MWAIKVRGRQLLTVQQYGQLPYRSAQTFTGGGQKQPPPSGRVVAASPKGKSPGTSPKAWKKPQLLGGLKPRKPPSGKVVGQLRLVPPKGPLWESQVGRKPLELLAGRSGVMPSLDPKFALPLWVRAGSYQPYLPGEEDEAKAWLLTVPPIGSSGLYRGVSASAEVVHRAGVLIRGQWSGIQGLRQRGSKLFPRFAARLRRYRVRTWWGGQWAHRATTYFTAGYWRTAARPVGYQAAGFSAARHGLVWRRQQFFAQRTDGENFRWQPNYRKKRRSQLTYKFLLHNGFYRRRKAPQWRDLLEEPLTLTMHRMIPQSLPDFTQSLFWNRKYFQKVLYRIKSYSRLRQYFWWDRSSHRLNNHLQSFINRFEAQLFIILRRMRLAPSYAVAYFLIRKGFVTVDGVTIYDVKFRLHRGAFIQLSMYRLQRFLTVHHNESFGEKERVEEAERGNRPHFGNRLGLYYSNLMWSVKRYHYQHLHVDYRSLGGVYLHDAAMAFSKYYRLHRTFKEYRRLFSLLFANGKFLL